MPAKKSSRRRRASTYPELPLLAVSVGVVFFVLQLLFLFYAADAAGELLGVFAALWLVGGVVFALGVVAAVRESSWSLLLLSGPAFSFMGFIALTFLSGAGYAFIEFLAQQ